MTVFKMSKITRKLLFLLWLVVQVTSTPTPPLTDQITRTKPLMEETVWLNPSASLYAPDASSSVHVLAMAGCGGNVTSSSGELTHSSYPLDIQGRVRCTWRISLEQGTRVSLLFNFLSLDTSLGCNMDFLEIWDGVGSSKTLLKRYCESLEKPERLVSKTNEVEVILQSNSSSSGRGFLATYTNFTGCSKNFTSLSGVIQTPHYPEDYPNNIQCTYSISVPTDHKIALSLEFLDLAYSAGCSKDFLEIWDGKDESSVPIGRYCGYLFGQWVRSKGSDLRLNFTSDTSDTRRGFELKYYAIKSDCNSTLNATQGSIASPDQTNSPCHWTITSQPGHVISLRFDRFFLKYSKGCARDYLMIRDGESVIGRYCGYQKGEFLYSKSSSITLEYVTTSVDDGAGFQIQYQTIIPPDCGGYLNNSRGSFQSPLFPENYPGNVRCAWQIEQLPGHVIDLVLDDFDLEFSINCTKDYLEVFDGPDNTSASLGRYCGAKRPDSHVTSSGDMVFVEFVADGSRSRKGFTVTYTGIKSDCPKNFTNTTGKFESPNYPDFYPKNYDCYWQISYALGYQIYLTFKYFDLEYTPNCMGDYVEILDDTVENATSRGKYCGYLVKRYPLVSTKNKLLIKFHTDDERASRGFVLTYEVDGTDYPPPPRTPTSNEVKQAIELVFYNLTATQWITNMDVTFKKLVANATSLYCADNMAKCRLAISKRDRQRRSTENMFKEEHIHLVPGFPTSGEGLTLVVVFYAMYPLGVNIDPKWSSIAVPQNALLNAIRSSEDHISSTFGASIKSIEPYNQTDTSSPTVQGKSNLVIGLSVGCAFVVLFVVIVIPCYFWRKKNHGKFIVKRCVTPIEFVDEKDEIELTKSRVPAPARRRASTLKVVDLDGNTH